LTTVSWSPLNDKLGARRSREIMMNNVELNKRSERGLGGKKKVSTLDGMLNTSITWIGMQSSVWNYPDSGVSEWLMWQPHHSQHESNTGRPPLGATVLMWTLPALSGPSLFFCFRILLLVLPLLALACASPCSCIAFAQSYEGLVVRHSVHCKLLRLLLLAVAGLALVVGLQESLHRWLRAESPWSPDTKRTPTSSTFRLR
jgi:hypothetical protein